MGKNITEVVFSLTQWLPIFEEEEFMSNTAARQQGATDCFDFYIGEVRSAVGMLTWMRPKRSKQG